MRVEQSFRALVISLGLYVLAGCAENPPAPIVDRVVTRTPVGQVAPVASEPAKFEKQVTPVASESTSQAVDVIALADESLATPESLARAPRKPLTLALTPSANPALVALLAGAKRDTVEERFGDANAKIDRALQIGPESPQVWHRFAKLKFAQGEYDQALTLAQRSNSLAPRDGQLRAINWLLVADIERIRGNNEAQTAALEQARQSATAGAVGD